MLSIVTPFSLAIRASSGLSLLVIAAIMSPSGMTVCISFKLCTAMWIEAIQQFIFEFFGKKPLIANLIEGFVEYLIPFRRDEF
jgi:hypothetical protein